MKFNTKIKFIFSTAVISGFFVLSVLPALASQITAGNILELLNRSREKEDLEALSPNDKLTRVAQDKLSDMIANHYFAHTSPQGITPWHWFEKENYDYQFAGENLAINFVSAEGQHEAWMNSPTHRKNILNPNYKEIGIAVGAGEVDGQMSIIAVQEFGALITGETVGAKQEFSADYKSTLIEKDKEIIPQVLSVKNDVPESMKAVPPGNAREASSNNGAATTYDLLMLSALVLFEMTLALIPLVFLAVGYENIIIYFQSKKPQEEVFRPVL